MCCGRVRPWPHAPTTHITEFRRRRRTAFIDGAMVPSIKPLRTAAGSEDAVKQACGVKKKSTEVVREHFTSPATNLLTPKQLSMSTLRSVTCQHPFLH